MNTVYEKFFQGFSVKVADTHGIVYTPQPIVQFMVRSVQEILRHEFGPSLSDQDVHIIDPFVGTGSFIVRIMREMQKSRLPYKYANELHCNEVMLLPYYIASMNIEHAYCDLTGTYQSFEGICLVDTFELAEGKQFQLLTEENTARVRRQQSAPIFVIIGNPPYNAGQVNENDNNKNRPYPAIDGRVSRTYGRASEATLLRKLNDPYVKAIRWASDRIGDEGIVAFVTNSSFVAETTFDGMRKHLLQDFNSIYVLDLKGNVRKDSMRGGIPIGEQHTVFGLAAMVGVAVTFFVKNSPRKDHRIYYSSVDWRATRQEKFALLESAVSTSGIEWRELLPNTRQDWLTEGMSEEFESLLPMGTKETKSSKSVEAKAVFKTFSLGVSTNRDAVVYDSDRKTLAARVERFCDDYNTESMRCQKKGAPTDIDGFVDYGKVKWSSTLKNHARRGTLVEFDRTKIRTSLYRPFTRMLFYCDPILNDRLGLSQKVFPNQAAESENRLMCLTDRASEKPFMVLVSGRIVDMHVVSPGSNSQCFPFYIYAEDSSNRRENVTDWALEQFCAYYHDDRISKWDIFHYVYALLHHPQYREKYAANLKRELPRIPFAPDFRGFAAAGARLADLHVNYEKQPEYPLQRLENKDAPLNWRVEKMKLSKDKTQLVYNDFLILGGIPPEAFEYRLGNRSALHWIVDQYQVSTDKRSGIVNDPNQPDDPEYIVRLIGQVSTVSLETVKIVKGLPPLA